MKRFLLVATLAFLLSGVSFAQQQPVAKKKCAKECCKGKECNKQDKIASKVNFVKPAATVKKAKAA